MLHNELCLVVGKWLRRRGRMNPSTYPYVAVEMVTTNSEIPDVFGWNYWSTILIEVKVSRSDFLSDFKKPFRQQPEDGLGNFRYYCSPENIIKEDEVPTNWGLLHYKDGDIKIVKLANKQKSCGRSENVIYGSIMRREGIKPQLFYYRNGSVECETNKISVSQDVKLTISMKEFYEYAIPKCDQIVLQQSIQDQLRQQLQDYQDYDITLMNGWKFNLYYNLWYEKLIDQTDKCVDIFGKFK